MIDLKHAHPTLACFTELHTLSVIPELLQIQNGYLAILNLDQTSNFKNSERLICALARGAAQITQLFLRNFQARLTFGMQLWIKQGGDTASDTSVRVKRSVVLNQRYKYAQTSIQLMKQKMIEPDACV